MAIMGDANVQSNNLIIGELTQRQLIAQSKLLGTILDVSSFAVPTAKSIEFPKAGNFTVVKKASGVPVTAEALTYTTDSLDLDQHAVIQWSVEKKAMMQSAVDVLEDALGRATRGHARQVDLDIYTELEATASSFAGDSGGTLGRAEITRMIQELDDNDVPEDDRFLAINPKQKKEIFDISDFIDASKFGSDQMIRRGQIGEIYGIPVLTTTVVTADNPVMYHREACAIGFQMAPEFDEDKDLPNLAKLYSLDQLYGVKGLLDGNAAVKITSL
jgi:hypothetical protein